MNFHSVVCSSGVVVVLIYTIIVVGRPEGKTLKRSCA